MPEGAPFGGWPVHRRLPLPLLGFTGEPQVPGSDLLPHLALQGISGSAALALLPSGCIVQVAVDRAPPTARGTYFLTRENEEVLVRMTLSAVQENSDWGPYEERRGGGCSAPSAFQQPGALFVGSAGSAGRGLPFCDSTIRLPPHP